MSLADWKSYQNIVSKISASIVNNRTSHAYIIEADSCIDKESFAKDFFKAVVCEKNQGIGCDFCTNCKKIKHDNYEDLYIIRPDGQSVKDDQILKLQEKLMTKPTGGERNLALICNADTMTVRAQNRLLKTLEEPTLGTIIILLSENRENLLDTIKSRCIIYRLYGLDNEDDSEYIGVASEIIEMIVDGSGFYNLKTKINDVIKNKSDCYCLLDGFERLFRKFMLDSLNQGNLFKREDIIKNIRYIEEARRDLNANVNYNYALKNLLIKIGG
ncbi:MAG: hypothetical protein PHH48_02860 [Eubacteriales bacterium]|nr:hypothetical protein [Eubacteriales bacterium]